MSAMRSVPVMVARTMTGAASVKSARSACDSGGEAGATGRAAAGEAADGRRMARIAASAAVIRGKARGKNIKPVYAERVVTAIDTKMSSSRVVTDTEMRFEAFAGNK